MDEFKIACCQMNVINDKKSNVTHAKELIEEASSNGVELVTLPEMFNTPYDNNKFIEMLKKKKIVTH